MIEPPVVNSSPIIALSRAESLHLLQVASERLLVPMEVVAEIRSYGPEDPAVRALTQTAWLETVETPPPPEALLGSNLGAGETAVLTWALAHPGTRAIIDDRQARA